MSGIQPGLTMVVGPPGTGKTDTAVQIMNVLYHNCPSQRTLIITHSNQALNDLFEKIMQVWFGNYSCGYCIKTNNIDKVFICEYDPLSLAHSLVFLILKPVLCLEKLTVYRLL